MIIVLTQAERDKFSAWLKQDVESNRLIVSQLAKVTHTEPVANRKRLQMAACMIVAGILDSIEDQTISNEECQP